MPCPPRKRTSFIIDSLPAIHFTATARGLIPFVYKPMPVTIFVPPLGASSSETETANTLKSWSRIREH